MGVDAFSRGVTEVTGELREMLREGAIEHRLRSVRGAGLCDGLVDEVEFVVVDLAEASGAGGGDDADVCWFASEQF